MFISRLVIFAGELLLAAAAAEAQQDATSAPTSQCASRRTPLEIDIKEGRRSGGYSYRPSDVMESQSATSRLDRGREQSPAGPFDSGFFFDSGIGPRGGNSPYMH